LNKQCYTCVRHVLHTFPYNPYNAFYNFCYLKYNAPKNDIVQKLSTHYTAAASFDMCRFGFCTCPPPCWLQTATTVLPTPPCRQRLRSNHFGCKTVYRFCRSWSQLKKNCFTTTTIYKQTLRTCITNTILQY